MVSGGRTSNDDGQHTLDVVRRPPVIARHGTGGWGYVVYREILYLWQMVNGNTNRRRDVHACEVMSWDTAVNRADNLYSTDTLEYSVDTGWC